MTTNKMNIDLLTSWYQSYYMWQNTNMNNLMLRQAYQNGKIV